MAKSDNIYAQRHSKISDFVFDDKVAAVFPDMINRSVPGYQSVVTLAGLLIARQLQSGGLVYDLGCSLGAVTFSILEQSESRNIDIKAVDNSAAMIRGITEKLNEHPRGNQVEAIEEDIESLAYEPAKAMILNFTLQFIPPAKRLEVLRKIHAALQPGGILLLAEKIRFDDADQHAFQTEAHIHFKRQNGYSELEISQKRTALEKVMIPESLSMHSERCRQAGFENVWCWFQCFNFAALIAVKA